MAVRTGAYADQPSAQVLPFDTTFGLDQAEDHEARPRTHYAKPEVSSNALSTALSFVKIFKM